MSFYTYVLYSPSSKRYYKGHCENLEIRIKEHNTGKTKSIKAFIPWELVYFEEFISRDEAINREKYFKSAAGRRFLKYKIGLNNLDGSSGDTRPNLPFGTGGEQKFPKL